MVSKKWLKIMADLLKIEPSDRVIELGAGTGNLSEEILKRGPKKLTLIEKDPDMIRYLRRRFSSDPRVDIVEKDIREVFPIRDYEKIAANPPYYLSSVIVVGLSRSEFHRAVMTFQREFAERMVAKPGSPEYGSLSVLSALLFKVELVALIGKSSFRPPPKVDSALLVIEPKNVPDTVREAILSYSRRIFSRKKRTLRKILKDIVGSQADHAPYADRRPYHLSPEEVLEVIMWLREIESG